MGSRDLPPEWWFELSRPRSQVTPDIKPGTFPFPAELSIIDFGNGPTVGQVNSSGAARSMALCRHLFTASRDCRASRPAHLGCVGRRLLANRSGARQPAPSLASVAELRVAIYKVRFDGSASAPV